jgi:hypothetical protein
VISNNFLSPRKNLLTIKQQAKVEKFENELRVLSKKRSSDAIAASKDFLLFRKYVCGHDTYEHMMVWHHELNTGQDNKYLRGIAGDDVCILSPRNSSKSTFLLQWVAYVIGTHVMQGISLKVLYISYAIDAAIGKSRQIKAIIESDRYQETFPLVRKSKSKWGESEWAIDFSMAGLRTIDEAYTLVCAGLKGSINSRRSHICCIDDPQKDIDEAKNKSIQDRMESNYNNILKYTRYDGSRFVTLGTRMAKHDAYSRIFVPPYYKVITQKALITEQLPNGKTFERSFWEPVNDDSPGIRIETLLKEKSQDYESFLLQRQNELPATTSQGISIDCIKYGWIPKKFDWLIIGADTADSTDVSDNATAFVVVGVSNDNIYVIDAWEGHISGNLKKIDKIYDLWEKRKSDCKNPAIIAVDQHRWSKGLSGDFESYVDDIEHDDSIDKAFATIVIERISSSGRGEKIDRLESHSYLFEKGRIYFNLISPKDDGGSELIPKLVNQITDYNPLDHNDLMDALECAIYIARQHITGSISAAG